jgi:hypothetical protein
MQTAELIALLLPDASNDALAEQSFAEQPLSRGIEDYVARGATALVRDASGRMSLELLTDSAAFKEQVMSTGCFRRGKPIIDPVSRQVMGYEMEMIAQQACRPQLAM